MNSKRIPDKLFQEIKKSVPLSCVDMILIKDDKFFLVKRKISPYKNKWCLPGGIIKRGQKIMDRLEQLGKEELGIKLEIIKNLGFYEKVYNERHDISHCYLVKTSDDKIKFDFQASGGRFFKKIPQNTAPFHAIMLRDAGFR